jgi:hypothetical protein
VFGRVQLELDPGGGSSSSGAEIWSMADDGSDLRVVATRGEATTPTWSPDGSRIAFLEHDANGESLLGSLRLVTSAPDGSDLTVVAEGLIDPLVPAVAWSPDGTRIAVLDTREHDLSALDDYGLPRADIAIYSRDGATERFVDVPGTANGFAWAPDGDGFAVARFHEDRPGVDLLRVDLDGHVLGTIATGIASGASPAWSPDGSRIAFVRGDPSAPDLEEGEVWVVNADGSDPVQITDDGGRKPSLAWSSDGTRILHSRQTLQRCDIVSVAANGSDRTVVADRTTMGGCAVGISVNPAIAPSHTPSPDTGGEGRDIGLPFRVCEVDTMSADFNGAGSHETAYIATRIGPEGCPASGMERDRFIGLDLDGDQRVDTSRGPLRCAGWCLLFGTPDLNRDGFAELLVNEGHVVSPVSAWIGVYGLDGSSIQPIPFPNGSNRFKLEEVASVPSFSGAYCFSDGEERVLSLWDAPAPVNDPSTHEVTERLFVIDVESFTFSLADTRSSKETTETLPPKGTDGRICGVETESLG